jgi:sulfofructose kinase
MQKFSRVDVVGVGLNATDTLIALDHYPAPGSKVEYQDATILPGGQVATTVIACRQWGLSTRYVGKLGDDDAARLHREAFAAADVEARLIVVRGAFSPQSLIMVDAQGERTILGRRDERLILQPGDLDREWIVNGRLLHIDGHDTAAATLASSWARDAAIPVVADLDELYPGIDDLLALIDYPIVSRDFPSRLMDEPDLELALQKMHRRYRPVLTAATLGEAGVLAWDGQSFHHARAYQVPVADTTGAGDIFHSGFIYGLLKSWESPEEWPLRRQLDFACAAAALNCTGIGARGGIRPVPEIEQLAAAGPRYPALELREAQPSADGAEIAAPRR